MRADGRTNPSGRSTRPLPQRMLCQQKRAGAPAPTLEQYRIFRTTQTARCTRTLLFTACMRSSPRPCQAPAPSYRCPHPPQAALTVQAPQALLWRALPCCSYSALCWPCCACWPLQPRPTLATPTRTGRTRLLGSRCARRGSATRRGTVATRAASPHADAPSPRSAAMHGAREPSRVAGQSCAGSGAPAQTLSPACIRERIRACVDGRHLYDTRPRHGDRVFNE